ncbi:bifunctional 5,10-methylene-tetrahydrofolate dehydrogenase/5,10-methylene-tetrahydrofolate cyclohydrolase [Haliangium ochraceum]|uniref:Bifunctional 5,10-methylene-tetrahydrofolate dehydrogenase:5,10-methylene-tetrahydrofolate cyclohydrolase n=1 Tax=Haliangium ochraceum (strain DSM 14365 / JCM 11303 / SMP-2) TaxID=502025 RepID=D0LKW0_HALO1|nr:bifunctional 5,10-methylene-tetrahydrofolate dehydrogenase/5,10-methylene-tetrahydrofolate cyclohydrolase [Haliangium ochraceum]ACY16680.1 bifunctional 5,10-methylene-tetrahydrofolate dehydrogenase:5,10-methylene-tetrahydrofolate cyclohydrolase [Haliangium ochraceum DSM 14365]
MNSPGKRIAVLVRTSEPARVAEALRAAVGLSLRGDRVEVVLPGAEPALSAVLAEQRRAIDTLRMLGHTVELPADAADADAAAARALRAADASEVWT